jgi:hypothetical protein
MENTDEYRKTDKMIAKFKNGKKRYATSPLFNKVIQMLVRGLDPYEVIDQLCQQNEDTNNSFNQYVLRDTRPLRIR